MDNILEVVDEGEESIGTTMSMKRIRQLWASPRTSKRPGAYGQLSHRSTEHTQATSQSLSVA